MQSIAEILRTQRVLIPEPRALVLLNLKNNHENREMLARVMPFELVMLPRQVRCYRQKDVVQLRDNLDRLSKQPPARP